MAQIENCGHLLNKSKLAKNCRFEAFMSCVKNNDFDGVKAKIDLDLIVKPSTMDYTALHYAVFNRNLEMVRFLVQYCSSIVNKESKGKRTALNIAVTDNFEEIVKFLLDNGASTESRNIMGCTPLYIAAYNGYMNLVKLLLEKGANPNTTDKFGNTAFEQAYTDEIEELLHSNDKSKALDQAVHSLSVYSQPDEELNSSMVSEVQNEMLPPPPPKLIRVLSSSKQKKERKMPILRKAPHVEALKDVVTSAIDRSAIVRKLERIKAEKKRIEEERIRNQIEFDLLMDLLGDKN